MYACMYVRPYVSMHVCMYVAMHVYACRHACMYVYKVMYTFVHFLDRSFSRISTVWCSRLAPLGTRHLTQALSSILEVAICLVYCAKTYVWDEEPA